MPLVVFDLDGCLVDSRRVVRDAYKWAGVDAPENVLEFEGIDWIVEQLDPASEIVAQDIRRAKAVRYLETIGDAKVLPPYPVACVLKRRGHTCVVLSGAPIGAIHQVQMHHRWTWPFVAGLDGCRTTAKQVALQSMARDLHPNDVPVYVDDQKVRVPKPWRFVHYIGQTEEELMEEITWTSA